MRQREREIITRMQFQKRTRGSEAVVVSVIFQPQFTVIRAAGRYREIADQRRIADRAGDNEKWADGIKRRDHGWLAGHDGSTEIRIEEILLNNAPGDEFLCAAVRGAAEQPVGDAVFDFI